MDISVVLIASLLMFATGVLGVLTRRNTVVFFLSIELMFNAANLLFVGFSHYWGEPTGLIWVFFVLVVAAAEAAVGLAIIIHLFRSRQTVDMDRYQELRETPYE